MLAANKWLVRKFNFVSRILTNSFSVDIFVPKIGAILCTLALVSFHTKTPSGLYLSRGIYL